jgi:hypothetical protein
MSVRRGGLGPWMPRRPTSLLRGDALVVGARVEGVANPSRSIKPLIALIKGGLKVEKEGWQGDTYVWRIRAESVGEFPLIVSVWDRTSKAPGTSIDSGRDGRPTFGRVEPLTFGPKPFAFDRDRRPGFGRVIEELSVSITVLGDVGNQGRATTTAMHELNTRFKVAERQVVAAGRAFNTAFRSYDAELKAVEAGQQHDRDMLWGILFAGLGGFVGGAVGGLVKPQVERMLTNAGAGPRLSNALREGITDAAKDPAKFGTRVLGRSYPGTLGDSTAPPGSRPRATARPPKRVGDNPQDFYLSLQGMLLDEQKAIGDAFGEQLKHLEVLAARDARALFSEDPVAWVSDAIDRVYPEMLRMRSWKEADWNRYYADQTTYYYEQLWGAWVKANYYAVRVESRATQVPKLGGAPYRFAVDTPGWRMNRQLRQVAKTCGYDLPSFLAKYGDFGAKVEAARGQRRHGEVQW